MIALEVSTNMYRTRFVSTIFLALAASLMTLVIGHALYAAQSTMTATHNNNDERQLSTAATDDERVYDEPIIIYMPMYSYLDSESGSFVGPEIDMLKQLIEAADIDAEFQGVSWVRALRQTQENPNSLLLPLSRTEERESGFHWIYKMRDIKFAIFGREDISLPDLLYAAKSEDEKIHCIKGGYQCKILIDMGFPENSIVANTDAEHARLTDLALRGRIKYFISEMPLVLQHLIEINQALDQLKVIGEYEKAIPEYIAVRSDASPDLVKALRAGAAKMPPPETFFTDKAATVPN